MVSQRRVGKGAARDMKQRARQGGITGASNRRQGEMGDGAGKKGNELEHAKHRDT